MTTADATATTGHVLTSERLARATTTIQLDEPVAVPSEADEVVAGLRAVADFVEANPKLATHMAYSLSSILASVSTRDQVVEFARAGKSAGLKVTKYQQGDKWAGVKVHFGRRAVIDAYARRDEVCERVVVGTKEVTEEVPDPEALAAVPKVTVTKVVDEVEWNCLPLLAEVGAR